jgi:hypothetical protein
MSANSPDDAIPQVLTEIQAGDGLSLSAAGHLYPAHRGSGTIAPSTVWRWARKGAKSADGRVIRLEVCRIGGRWLTSRGALVRFVNALSHTGDSPATATSPPATRTASVRRKSCDRAIGKLKERGA